jgi:hypothetical protein
MMVEYQTQLRLGYFQESCFLTEAFFQYMLYSMGGGGRLSFWGIPYVLDQAVTQEIDQKYNCKVER